MSIEKKLESLGLSLPPVPKAIASYIPANSSGKLVFTSGQLPSKDGKILFIGKVGTDATK
ncbi:MAG: RidA family protein, partial [Leptospira sp.]|nr:RidA family protein [Leptospira sp.]